MHSLIISKSGGQFNDGRDFGVEKWETSNISHEMCAPHVFFVLAINTSKVVSCLRFFLI